MNAIASERVRARIDQRTLAKAVGVSPATVSRWERGVGEPTGSKLVAMSRVFGCSTDYLLGLTDDRNKVSA